MSTVIKAGSGPVNTDRVAFNYRDVTDNAERYLEGVRKEAEEILSQAHERAKTIRKQAEVQGRDDAKEWTQQAIDEQVATEMKTLMPALRGVIEDMGQAKHEWLSHWEKRATHVAIAISKRILGRELTHDPKITLNLVTEALELAEGSADVRILMNPHDLETLGDEIRRLTAEVSRLAPSEVLPDESVGRGGCRVETRHGAIENSFEAQLDRIEEELT